MKNILPILILGIHVSSFSQLLVTPFGLRNAKNMGKTYVMIKAGNLSAKKLYDNAIQFITDNYSDPKQAIRSQSDTEDLIFDTYVPEFLLYNNTGVIIQIDALYTTELRFYDGMLRYEVISLEMKGAGSKYKLLFKGKWLKAYIVYKDNGKLFKPKTKSDIENYFNEEINRITLSLEKP